MVHLEQQREIARQKRSLDFKDVNVIAKDHMSQTRMRQDVKRSMAMTLQSHNKISMNHKLDHSREIASLDR